VKEKIFRLFAAAITMLAVASFAGRPPAEKKDPGMKALELSSALSPSIKIEPAFLPAIRSYTAVVDSTNVQSVKIDPVPFSAGSRVTINGGETVSGRPYVADLKPGENRFEISVFPAGGKNAVQYQLTIIQKDLSGQYTSERVQAGVWRLADYGGFPPNQNAYLIEGPEKAVLIDTGMGKGDLAGTVKSLTSRPVEVAVTHGHGDHAGQIGQFPASVVYMSEKDKGMLPAAVNSGNFKWVKDGDKIGLGGGRYLEVVEVPGHSAGSIMFLDRIGKTLAIGDAIGSGSYVWKFIPGTSSLSEYRDTLKKLESRLAPFDALTFLTGHHWQERTPLTGTTGKQMVTDMRILCEKIISGEITGTPNSINLGGQKMNVLTASYGLAGIWYDPENLHQSK